jgi:D-arabinose 1-dehydrogenase-like Zn-dependent alcohol dehydrogenase
MRVEAQYLMRLPDYLTFQDGAILACQGGTAYAPLARMGVSGRHVLVVSGLGPVGLLSLLFGQAMGATVVGIDPSAGRRAIARDLGAVMTLDPAAGPVGQQLREQFPDGADLLTETSGAAAAYDVLGDLLRPRAMAALVGGGPEDVAVPRRHLNSKETMVFGSSAYAPIQFEQICQFVRRNRVKLDSVVSETFALQQGPEAFRIAADANTGKVMFGFP